MAQIDEHIRVRHQPVELVGLAPAAERDPHLRRLAQQFLQLHDVRALRIQRPDDGVLHPVRELLVCREHANDVVDAFVGDYVADRRQLNPGVVAWGRPIAGALTELDGVAVTGKVEREHGPEPAAAQVTRMLM